MHYSSTDRQGEQPWLSIVTAVLDAPKQLAATLDCIGRRACGFEHIIIDGGSDSPTQAVLERARSNGAHVVSERDEGIYQALNKGLRLARGRYICVLHAGDWYSPEDLDRLNAWLTARIDEAPVVYYSDCTVGDRRVTAPNHLSAAIDLYNLSIAHQSMIVPRQVYEEVGEYREDFRIVSDHIWMRAAHRRGVGFRKLADSCVRLDDTGLSSGQTVETRQLFESEIIRRTQIYYPFLPERICCAVLEARWSAVARDELWRFVSASDPQGMCAAATWRELQDSVRDYVRIFGDARLEVRS